MANKIIVIEGTDGCGKETQSKLLESALNKQGLKTFRQSFPNYGTAGAKPVECLLSGELGKSFNTLDAYQSSVLFAVDRLFTFKSILEQKLSNGEIIIFDRYVESNLLYQATRMNNRQDYEKYVKWLLDLEYDKLKLPKPSLIIYLNMPPKQSLELVHNRELKSGLKDDIYEKDVEYMNRVYNLGLQIAKEQKFEIIDCLNEFGKLKDINTIHNEILQKVNEKLMTHIIEK